MNNHKTDEKIDEIVDQIADEIKAEEHDHTDDSEVEEIVEEMADDLETTEKADKINLEDVDPLRLLEAMLFASAQPISPQAMLERLPESADLNVLLPQLKDQYDGRGIELVEINGSYALRTAKDVGDALTVEKEVNRKMSKAALETLAIIAYHQPITRAEIENIRGVATHKGTLDILMEMGWVKPGRRRETPGRPLTWVSTNDFMDHFQLEAMTDLPGLDELKASGLLDRRAAIDTIPDTGDLFDSGDVDAEEVLDQSDDDAYDEQTYKEIKARVEKTEEPETFEETPEETNTTGEEE